MPTPDDLQHEIVLLQAQLDLLKDKFELLGKEKADLTNHRQIITVAAQDNYVYAESTKTRVATTGLVNSLVNSKAPLANPSFTGTVNLTGASSVSFANAAIPQAAIDNLSTSLAAKAPLASPSFTGNVNLTAASTVAFAAAAIPQAAIANLPTSLDAKAPLANPSFTGNVNLAGAAGVAFPATGVTFPNGAIAQAAINNLSTSLAAKAGIEVNAALNAPTTLAAGSFYVAGADLYVGTLSGGIKKITLT